MPWTIFATILWLFILLFLRSDLGRLWSAGFWAIVVGYFLNIFFITHGFFVFQELLYSIEEVPLGYFIGIAGIGIIIMRFLPEEKIWRIPYLILFSVLFAGLEYFSLEQGYILYLNWSLFYSFIFKLIAFITITWLSSITIKGRTRSYLYR